MIHQSSCLGLYKPGLICTNFLHFLDLHALLCGNEIELPRNSLSLSSRLPDYDELRHFMGRNEEPFYIFAKLMRNWLIQNIYCLHS